MSKLTKVELIWIDSVGPEDHWWNQDDVDNLRPGPIMTCGYIVSEGKHYITVASSVAASGEAGGIVCIPKVAIHKERRKKCK
jgi:hypothetical protein